MKYAWFVIVIWSARFIVTAVEYPSVDGDLAWQCWLGKTILTTHRIPRALGSEVYTAVGAPWVPQEWLFSIFAYLGTSTIAWKIFAASAAFCALGTLFFVSYRAMLRGAAPLDVAFVAMLTGIAMVDSFGVRAQVVVWFMLALMLFFLDNDGPLLWIVVPVAALWSNMHASAMLAPVLTAASALGRLIEDKALTQRVKRAGFVAIAVIPAICCNPFGVGLPLYAISLLGNPITKYISEWRITDIGADSFYAGSLPLLIAAVVFGIRSCKKTMVEDILIFTIFVFILFFAARNIPIFAIVVAPIVAANRKTAFPSIEEATNIKIPDFALPLMVGVCVIAIVYRLYGSKYRMEQRMPVQEVFALTKIPGERRVFCSNFAWCSFFLGYPHVRVFLDGRADPYPLRVWKDYAGIAFVQPNWMKLLNDYKVDSVIDKHYSDLDQALELSNKWQDAFHDSTFRLWLRKP
jgi:hypothetical protein